MQKREVARASELVRVYRAVGGGPVLSTPLRYALAVAVVALAVGVMLLLEAVLHSEPITFVELIVAVVLSSRFLGAGPSWLTAALAAAFLAWELPPDGSFAVDPGYQERFLGTVAAYLVIVLFRPGSFGGAFHVFRTLRGYRSLTIRRISSLITRRVKSSSVIGYPDASRSSSA